MVEALKTQEQDRAVNELSFLERLALLGRSTMDLAREPGAGAKTESGQAERTSLRGGHRLSCCAGPGQDGNAYSGKRLGLGPQSRKHFRVGSDRRGQEFYRFGLGPESLSRRLLGFLFAGSRFVA